jgi:hypothetical protein
MTKSDPPGRGSGGNGPSKEDRLAKALRENLKRRKAAPAPPTPSPKNPD